MKELRYILGKKQADGSVIFVKGISGEEVERAFNYYDALDYKSISYAKKTREVFNKLDDFDLYRANIEVINMEPQREEERALKEAEELKKQIEKETAEDNTDVTEIEDEKINVESTDEPVEENEEEPETGEEKKEETELTDGEETNS